MAVAEGGDPTRVVGRRVVGGFFDAVIDQLFLWTLYGLVGIKVMRGTLGTTSPEVVDSKIGLIAAGFLIYVVVTKVLSLAYLGFTPGMFMVGVRCVKYDGRGPGIGRALVRTLVYQLLAQFGALWYLLSYLIMSTSKAHKSLQDMVAGTYVIDAMYMGHLMILDSQGNVVVGPKSVTREEAAQFLRQQGGGAPAPAPAAAQAKNGEPFLDKNLDTYVVWNERHKAWLAFDKATGGWVQIG
jgi:uncharacterized RDD family membrane protein YckC